MVDRRWRVMSENKRCVHKKVFIMESCNCIDPQWLADELLMKYQYISDFFIALAYFSIPLELIYFVKKLVVFPYRWVLVQFSAVIILCGATHFCSATVLVCMPKAYNLIKPIASVKKLSVTLSLSSDLPEYAIGDEKRLMQVLLNVVGNAVKFSKEGSVSVSAFVAKSEFLRDPQAPDFFPVITVKDTGVGINPLDIPKIFSKFAQNQSLATKNSGGSGLGLAICKRFVNLREGHIWIESEGLDKGANAIFIVKLGIPGENEECFNRAF
ncbi:ethylene receptor-like [Ipomoea triloba]|uniref:ethylene receptor-like n=1 Tax=Ipomoea triloba TaxID=35885 RepID=UPI00125D54AC|nr:ethylene receptor-like [Ipomoea triloba]